MRVLCLHENGSNALDLKSHLHKLGDRLYLNHGIDLVYVNAPLVDIDTMDNQQSCGNDIDEYGPRLWWKCKSRTNAEAQLPRPLETMNAVLPPLVDKDEEENEEEMDRFFSLSSSLQEDPSLSTPPPPSFLGLDASLLLLRQIWTSSSTVGIVGVGQGASMAALLTLFLQQQTVEQKAVLPPQFAIFINGRSTLFPDWKRDEESSFRFGPSPPEFLHVCSGNASLNRMEEARLLHQQFGGEFLELEDPEAAKTTFAPVTTENNPQLPVEDKDETPPWTPSTRELNRMGRFLVDQKNRLSLGSLQKEDEGSSSAALVVALQQELHHTEQEASELIAREIAANPPKALMAIIQPSRVSGRHDGKVQHPQGGAPCPPEFLLHRQKRTNGATAGPSRAHPSNSSETSAKK